MGVTMFWALLAAFSCIYLAQAASLGFNSRIGLNRVVLQPRQSITNVPAQCQSTCDPITTAISSNTCTPTTCCTTQFDSGYFSCLQCVGQAINLTDYTLPQQTLDSFVEECAQSGISIPSLTFPGQDPNRPLSTQPVSQSSTSAISHSTITTNSLGSASQVVQTTVTSTTPGTSSPLFTQTTVSVLSTPSSTATQSGSNQNSGNALIYNPFLAALSTFLIGCSFLLV